MNNPTDTISVDTNTDDLDAFSDLFEGKTQETKAETEVDTVETEEEVTPLADDEDTNEAGENLEDLDKSDDDDQSEEKEDEPKEKPKKVNRFQERINELTAKAREAERALEALRAEQARKQEESEKTAPKTSVVQNDGPTPTDKNEDGSDKYPLGEFDPQYIRDMARHTIDKEWAARQEQEAKARQEREAQEARDAIQKQWVERLAPVTEQHEDYIEKTLQLEDAFTGLDPQYSDYLVQTIKSLEHGPEVLYYFANNLEEAKKFVQSGPLNATLALGEINAMFKGQTRKEAKVSKAPPPPQVNKGTSTRKVVSGDTDDLDAFSAVFFKK